MNLIERSTIIHYHRWRVQTYGANTAEALGWVGPENQRKRFEVLESLADLNSRTLLDVGCGYGDLKGDAADVVTGFVTANDTLNSATVTSFQNTGNAGGTVTISSIGQLTYTPPAGQSNIVDKIGRAHV